ncbi:MAG: adenylosuccinate lyase [Bacilli bacterium]
MIERYSTPQMKKLWSDENRFNSFLKVELASLEALSNLGIVPLSDFLLIKNNARFDVSKIIEIEEITKHDVIAFTRAVSLSLGNEKKWFHFGMTSTDIVDSANSLIIKEVNEILLLKMYKLLDVFKEKAIKYQSTPCIGRTHGMHAEVTSFGLKWVLYYDELLRLIENFNNSRVAIEQIKMSGAVGNFTVLPIKVEEIASKILGLGYAKVSTQVLSRDRHTSYIFSLAQIASLMEKVATEIRHLSRTEIMEVSEFFDIGQKGSSAMPHKKNPIASENICGCSRIMKSYVNVAFENNNLWHERDISHSSSERIMLADATTLLDYMLERFIKVVDKLIVYEDRMKKNISLTNNIVYSGSVLNMLVTKNLSREEAYDLIQPLTFKAIEDDIDFYVLVKELNLLSSDELQECFSNEYYLRNVRYIYERVGI